VGKNSPPFVESEIYLPVYRQSPLNYFLSQFIQVYNSTEFKKSTTIVHKYSKNTKKKSSNSRLWKSHMK
jgi:hypothetical protein